MIDRNNYNLCISKNFLCVPSVLQTILLYHNISFNENEIKNYFTINIPENYENLKGIETNNPDDYGIKLLNSTLNDFFKYFNFPLHEEYMSIFVYEDWSFNDAIEDLLNTNNHIVCGFSYGSLYNEPNNISIGHVSIITKKNGAKIQLLDPGPKYPGLKYVDSYDLYVAIKTKKDGLWLISEVSNL